MKKQNTNPYLILEEPKNTDMQIMIGTLHNRHNKDTIQKYFMALQSWFKEYDKVYLNTQDDHTIDITDMKEKKLNIASKMDLVQDVALVLASKSNLKQYVDDLSPKLKELWRKVLLNGYVGHDKAKEIMDNSSLFTTRNSYYYSSGTISWKKIEYEWFTTSRLRSRRQLDYVYSSYVDFITVSNAIRGIFFTHFFPEIETDDLSIKKLPEGQWNTLNFEIESLTSFNLFSGLYQQGELPMKKKGVTAADMKRANKKLALKEFFPDSTNEYQQYIRVYNYMGVLALNQHLKSAYKAKKVLTYPETLKDLFSNFNKLNNYLPALLYPHIKGLRQNQTLWGNHYKLCEYMLGWMKQHPENWVNLIEIFIRIVNQESTGDSNIYTALVYRPSDEQSTSEITNQYTSTPICADSYAREFGLTGLKSLAFMLASLGMAEVALTTEKMKAQSPYDALAYIRLTPLGRYVLGATTKYEGPELQQEAYFELDPDRLIIRSLKDPNPYEQLLRDTAMPITHGRFQTSPLSFLNNCTNRSDVEGKISIFKQFIANELPPLWEQFFQSLLQHCNPLHEDKTAYKHYTLQPDNRDLINLITTDPVLRQIAIRAEDYRIMVKTEDLRKFVNQLKKHGYLL